MGDLSVSKKIIFCVFMYNMSYSFALFTAKAWRKNGVEAIDCSGKIWLNQGYLQEKLDIRNISDKTQYHSDEFKKRCKIQECSKYQPCRTFIENTLAVEITLSAVKTQAVTFRSKFGVKQQSIMQTTIIRFKTEKVILKRRHSRRIFCFTLQN